MTDEAPFQMSQGLEVLRPKSGQAYPIPLHEWSVLKGKIKKITREPWGFHTMGSLLTGAGLSTLVGTWIGTFQVGAQQRQLDLGWVVAIAMLICGVLCFVFAHRERGVFRERANEVVAQMDLIETRYDRSVD